MARIKLIDGREGFFIGLGVGAIVYWINYYVLQNPELYSAIAMAAVSPSPLESVTGAVLAPTFKTLFAYIVIGGILGFLIDIVYTWYRRNF